jgi:hypothetical protein
MQPYEDDGYDGVQYDTFYAPDPHQLEAEEIRRECLKAEQRARAARAARAAKVIVTRPY